MNILIVTLGLALALFGQVAAASGSGSRDRVCSKTAAAAQAACMYDVLDEYWITTGKCKNLVDSDARAECFADLRSLPREGRLSCREQREARSDLCEDLGEAPVRGGSVEATMAAS